MKLKSPTPPRRTRKAAPVGMFDELVVDLFAGGGGASLGIERALGRPVSLALNHNPEAIRMHAANHPLTDHLEEDVWRREPTAVLNERFPGWRSRGVGLLWASPDCRHFSRAKGAKPVSKKIRSLAWVIVKWAAQVKPRMIALENVREFQDWGPLVHLKIDGKPRYDAAGQPVLYPCKDRKGQTFRRFVSSLRKLGYAVEWRVLDAADFGAPTHRRRLFMVARRDGQPIVWPEKSHASLDRQDVAVRNVRVGKRGDPKAVPPLRGHDSGRRSRSLPRLLPYRTAAECIDWNIPCPSIFERARPLAPKTLRRIAMGIIRYVLHNPRPFVVTVNHGGEHFRGSDIDAPLSTVCKTHGYGVVAPTLVQTGYGEREGQAARAMDIEQPLGTVVAGGAKHAVAAATLLKHYGGVVGQPIDQPSGTVTAVDHHSLCTATLVGVGGRTGDSPPCDVAAPLNTITSKGDRAVVAATLVEVQNASSENGARDVGRPLNTVTANPKGGGVALAAASMVRMNHGDKQWNSVTEPLGTVTSQGNKAALVYAFLASYYGQGSGKVGHKVDEPLRTVTSRDRFGLMTVEVGPGELGVVVEVPGKGPHVIVDIGLRMLAPRELARCQGFGDDYVLEGTKTSQVARIGNSVCPPVAEAIVRANLAGRVA